VTHTQRNELRLVRQAWWVTLILAVGGALRVRENVVDESVRVDNNRERAVQGTDAWSRGKAAASHGGASVWLSCNMWLCPLVSSLDSLVCRRLCIEVSFRRAVLLSSTRPGRYGDCATPARRWPAYDASGVSESVPGSRRGTVLMSCTRCSRELNRWSSANQGHAGRRRDA
jgi:hypothetical protein